jgi:F-type H+-transporting ATPase subunit a
MADAILHIKDGYYFEVPKFLWRANFSSLEDVPGFLTEAHPEATVDEFSHAMDGKILIPQPFGRLENLHESASGFCISRFMLLELLVAIVLVAVFKKLSKSAAGGKPVPGRFANFLEVILLYVRDQIARPAIGKHDADRFVPLLWTMFFFILGCNLLGLIPWAGAATGAFGTTLALACVIICTSLGAGIKKFGPAGFFGNFLPQMDLPWFLIWLKFLILPLIFVIELAGMFIRHGVLGVRLLANMFAGHVVLLGILGLIAGAATASTGSWFTAMAISVVGSTLFLCLELFVAFLQAFIFTFLSALFIGTAVHKH